VRRFLGNGLRTWLCAMLPTTGMTWLLATGMLSAGSQPMSAHGTSAVPASNRLLPRARLPATTMRRSASGNWGVEYREAGTAKASYFLHYQSNSDGYCSGGGRGYNCRPQPEATASDTVPSMEVSASVFNGCIESHSTGNGVVALGQLSAVLVAGAVTFFCEVSQPEASAAGMQSFEWFDEVIPPRANRKHPRGSPILLTATLALQSNVGPMDCALINYFVALVSAPNMEQLNQPGGCPGQAPGTPLGSATLDTSYGAAPIPISAQLLVYTDVSVLGGGKRDFSEFNRIEATFHLDSPRGVHYTTASGYCYRSRGHC
jgi:hypothetical protein